ncbi:hypothetical protein DFH06DRAFT_1467595 [Mycena polygramma]|nr:hypothetical protein DFH06DRAFT_1467595 [Mycena polygramma]
MSGTARACGCLNVRIIPVLHDAPLPDFLVSTFDFTPVHVGDEGISVVYPHLTWRIHTHEDYTSLTCLNCRVLVYRVHRIDGDGHGPVMPTEEWVEQDILKSSSGWIEVHSHCLTGDGIAHLQTSSEYSELFSLTISVPSSLSASPQPPVKDPPHTSYLAHLPSLLLPPPFTSGHPVFVHLANIAKTESEARRAAAERELADIVRAKSAELACAETRRQRQVETLWRQYKSAKQMYSSEAFNLAPPRLPGSPASRAVSGAANSTLAGSPVVRERTFIPQPVPSIRETRAPAISFLPAPLGPSGFHAPRPQPQPTSRARHPASISSSSSGSLSGSSVTLTGSPCASPRTFIEGASVLQFRRKLGEGINTAASYQFFRNVGEDMARSRRERAAVAPQPHAEAPHARPSDVNGNGKKGTANGNGVERHVDENANAEEAGGMKTKDKGKPKMVTFEPQPQVVTNQRNIHAEREEEARCDEMLFDFEEDSKQQRASAEDEGVVMPFVEQPAQRALTSRSRRSKRKPSTDSTGLPQSFSVLRPASLPVPSHIRAPYRGTSPRVVVDEESAEEGEEQEQEQEQEEEQEPDSQDQEILKLVGANTLSHRGRWKKDSDEWRTLVSRDRNSDEDEDDYDDGQLAPRPTLLANGSSQTGIPSSMPIAIRPLVKPHEKLSLASYRPKTMSPAPQDLEPKSKPAALRPSRSVRSAVYAQRDIQRGVDPGAFAGGAYSVIEEGDEDEGDENDNHAEVQESGSTSDSTVRGGRQCAFKILRACDELPHPGMCSLAS